MIKPLRFIPPSKGYVAATTRTLPRQLPWGMKPGNTIQIHQIINKWIILL